MDAYGKAPYTQSRTGALGPRFLSLADCHEYGERQFCGGGRRWRSCRRGEGEIHLMSDISHCKGIGGGEGEEKLGRREANAEVGAHSRSLGVLEEGGGEREEENRTLQRGAPPSAKVDRFTLTRQPAVFLFFFFHGGPPSQRKGRRRVRGLQKKKRERVDRFH